MYSQNSGVPFTLLEQAQIREYIRQLYFGSPTALNLLESGTAGGQQIRLFQASPAFVGVGFSSTGIAGFNLGAINHLYYFNRTGQFVNEIPGLTIIHELFHAIAGTPDLPLGSG